MSDEWQNGSATRLARVEQRVQDIDNRLNQLVPVSVSVVRLEGKVEALRSDVARYAKDTQEDTRSRRNTRVLIITVSTTLVAAIIGSVTVIVTSLAR